MKPINEFTLAEIANAVEATEMFNPAIASRLRELHDLTRWIPVSERMPTKEDANEYGHFVTLKNGFVSTSMIDRENNVWVWNDSEANWDVFGESFIATFTHWRRIDKPEGV